MNSMPHFTTLVLTMLLWPALVFGSAPVLTVNSPRDGARIVQEQDTVLVSGKVSSTETRSSEVDIMFVIDVSGSTRYFAGVDFDDADLPSKSPVHWGRSNMIFGGGFGMRPMPGAVTPSSSILAAEVIAGRRLLKQLNPATTRVGLVTFGERADLFQPLTQQFDRVEAALDEVYQIGPQGGTNMVGGIRLAIRELSGLGQSQVRPSAVKVQLLLTDGYPTLPIGGGNSATPEDTNLAINGARLAAKAGIKIHTFALGEDALSQPRAAVGVAKVSGGTFTPVVRPADILAVLEKMSVVGVDYVEVTNETLQQRSLQMRLAADGFFSAAVPMKEGKNQIRVLARSSSGAVSQKLITVDFRQGGQRSMDLEVFLEKERQLNQGIEKLGK